MWTGLTGHEIRGFEMKIAKKYKTHKDDSLFGLLSSCKPNNTYFKVLVSEKENFISVILTDNPGKWPGISISKYSNCNELKRLEIGNPKLSLKYLCPEHLVRSLGPLLGIKIPISKAMIIDKIANEGYFILEMPIRYKEKLLYGVNKILNLSPEKKYEIMEKSIAGNQE